MPPSAVLLPPVLLALAACGGGGSPAPGPAAVTSPPADPDPLRADGVRASRWIGAAIQSRLLSEPAYLRTLVFWGFTDRYSWIDSFFGPDDPLLFDDGYAAKPAFFGVQDALRRR